MILELFEYLHQKYFFDLRVNRLADLCLAQMPLGKIKVLDIGCGSGQLAAHMSRKNRDLEITGIDTQVRPQLQGSALAYNGRDIPFPDAHFDVAMLIDVLHHADDPLAVLREAQRVAGKYILVKDHISSNWFDARLLHFMDSVGNRRFLDKSTCSYKSRQEWLGIFDNLGLRIDYFNDTLTLRPFPINIAERRLHFLVRLKV